MKNDDMAIADYEKALRLGLETDGGLRELVQEQLAEARERKAAGGGSSVSPSTAPAPSKVDASGILTDSRDGKKYKTVVIGGKRWMGENLNYQPSGGSWCYGDDNSNCGKYGRMYDWNTAKTVCPAGYHLPSRQEWQSLVDYVGGDNKAGTKLKARSGWKYNSGNGTDDYGFSALPGGNRNFGGNFFDVGGFGLWWTATEDDSDYAYYRGMNYNLDSVYELNNDKSYGLSVRCVSD